MTDEQLQKVVDRLSSGNVNKRRGAAQTLSKAQQPPTNTHDATLLRALSDDDPQVRTWIALHLAGRNIHLEKVIATLQPLYTHSNSKVRLTALRALRAVNRHRAPALDELVAACTDSDWKVVCEAASGLGDLGAQAGTAVPTLIDVLGTGQRAPKRKAAFALSSIGDARAIAALADALVDTDCQRQASVALAGMQLPLDSIVTQLIAALDVPATHDNAFRALGHTSSEQAVATVLPWLRNPNCRTDPMGVAFAKMPALSAKQLGLALDYAQDHRSELSMEHAQVLCDVFVRSLWPEALTFVVGLLGAPSLGITHAASQSLSRNGDACAPALPAMTAVLRGSESIPKILVIRVLRSMGAAAMPVRNALIEAVEQDPSLAYEAAPVLGHVAAGSERAATLLCALAEPDLLAVALGEPSRNLRQALSALAGVAVGSQRVLALCERAATLDTTHRELAAWVLVCINNADPRS